MRRARRSGEPIGITQRGRATGVVLSAEAYERVEHDRQLLRLLARGDKEIAVGKGHALSAVLAEADRVLAEDQPAKIVFTPSARSQFLSALTYIRRDNPAAA